LFLPVAGQLAKPLLNLALNLVGSAIGAQIGRLGTHQPWLPKSGMNPHALV
jgi:hypothetical protein